MRVCGASLGKNFPRALFGADLGLWFNFPLSILLLVAVLRLFRTNLIWGFVVLGYMAQSLFFFDTQRYLLPVVPLMVYALWDLLCAVDDRKMSAIQSHWARRLPVVVFWFWVAANLVKIGDFTLEQRAQPFWIITVTRGLRDLSRRMTLFGSTRTTAA